MVGVIYIQNIQHIQLFYHGMNFMSSRYTKKKWKVFDKVSNM